VNSAILKDFGGSNLAVPVRYAPINLGEISIPLSATPLAWGRWWITSAISRENASVIEITEFKAAEGNPSCPKIVHELGEGILGSRIHSFARKEPT